MASHWSSWTNHEEARLRELWPLGIEAAVAALPRRTRHAIENRAGRLGLVKLPKEPQHPSLIMRELRKRRLELRMDQTELANAIGCGRSRITRGENRQMRDLIIAEKWAVALGLRLVLVPIEPAMEPERPYAETNGHDQPQEMASVVG